MCGSGARIGMGTTAAVLRRILLGLRVERAVCFGAAAGTTLPGSVARRVVTTTRPPAVATASGFALFAHSLTMSYKKERVTIPSPEKPEGEEAECKRPPASGFTGVGRGDGKYLGQEPVARKPRLPSAQCHVNRGGWGNFAENNKKNIYANNIR